MSFLHKVLLIEGEVGQPEIVSVDEVPRVNAKGPNLWKPLKLLNDLSMIHNYSLSND